MRRTMLKIPVINYLKKMGLSLEEIAPGVDLQRDILDQMDFQPIIRKVRAMDPRIFRPEPMGLTLP